MNKINLLIQENNIVVVVTFYQFMKQMIGLIWGRGGDGMELLFKVVVSSSSSSCN